MGSNPGVHNAHVNKKVKDMDGPWKAVDEDKRAYLALACLMTGLGKDDMENPDEQQMEAVTIWLHDQSVERLSDMRMALEKESASEHPPLDRSVRVDHRFRYPLAPEGYVKRDEGVHALAPAEFRCTSIPMSDRDSDMIAIHRQVISIAMARVLNQAYLVLRNNSITNDVRAEWLVPYFQLLGEEPPSTVSKKGLKKLVECIRNRRDWGREELRQRLECLASAANITFRVPNAACYTRPSVPSCLQGDQSELVPRYDRDTGPCQHCTYEVTQPVSIHMLNTFALCLAPSDWQPCSYMMRALAEPIDIKWMEEEKPRMVGNDFCKLDRAAESVLLGMLLDYSNGGVEKLEDGNLLFDCLMLLKFIRQGGAIRRSPAARNVLMVGVGEYCSISKIEVAAFELELLQAYFA